MGIQNNKTFGIGPTSSLNACVGKNGLQDLRVLGSGYDEAVKILVKAAQAGELPLDSGIYPLVFCARHRIELFLKDQLLSLNQIRNEYFVDSDWLMKTHDLSVIWKVFRKHGEHIDRRIREFLNVADEYINDFTEIDPTGQTFRYPHDKSKRIHLENVSIINIERFWHRYNKLSEMMEGFERLSVYLEEEYAQGTYTDKLSRVDILEISKLLPLKEKWTCDNFDSIKLRIRDSFGLSNRQLSKAIAIIQNHREFCVYIGLEIPIPGLTLEDIKKYRAIFVSFWEDMDNPVPATSPAKPRQHDHNYGGYTPGHFTMTSAKYAEQIRTKLSATAIASIYALVETGTFLYFSETYDKIAEEYKNLASVDANIRHYCQKLVSVKRSIQYLKVGLEKTGQKSLLSAFT